MSPRPQRRAPLLPRGAAASLVAAIGLTADAAEQGTLVFPVDCELGHTCVIQQYVDRDPGAGALDYTCGPLAHDGHKGTDIRLPDRVAMAAGVDVLSATSGRVVATRDEMPDIAQRNSDAPNVRGRECGNAVLVERADGWQFHYCHLARGSVSVSPGDEVAPGQVLGRIGLSGQTQFPHLRFSIRDNTGRAIDPFDAREHDESCRLSERKTMWATLDPNTDYQPGGPLAAGFATGVPDYDAVRAGTAHTADLPPDAPALVFWVHFFGVRQGDSIVLELVSPDGTVVATDAHQMTRNRATQFRAVGRRVRGRWAPGSYHGTAELMRDGAPVARIGAVVEVR